MKLNLKDKIIGCYRLNKSIFFNVYDKGTEISKGWVIQLVNGFKREVQPWITYDCGYKIFDLFFIRFGYIIYE